MNSKQPACYGSADQRGRGNGCVEAGDGPAALAETEPVCQVNNHSWEEAGLRESKKEPSHVELPRCSYEARQDCDQSPRDHYSRNPFPGTPAFDDDCSRYFKQNITDIEDAYSKTINAVAEAQIDAHPEIGKGNVDAVNVVDDIDQEDERQKTERNTPPGSDADFG